ncbi:MAG: signal peptidase I [Candidatus Bathyarchaeia archaeon]
MKRSETLKSEFAKTAVLLVIVAICVGGFWLALRAALRTEFPLHAVVSESMVPTLQVGDLLVVQGVVNASGINAAPETGDIIVFRKPTDASEFIVHRAIDKIYRGESWFFKTKGDNNRGSDPWEVPENYVIGKVIGRVPLLGYLKIFMGGPWGIALFILLILILLFADYIPMLRERSKT